LIGEQSGMAYIKNEELMTVIDIGSSKIQVLIARVMQGVQYELVGIGKSASQGIHKGVVVDIGHAMRALSKAIKDAETMAGNPVRNAYVSIAGSHIFSLNSSGTVPIKGGTVQISDVSRALDATQAIATPEGKQILHLIPQSFLIDGKEVGDPVSMHGIRLEVKAHIILGSTSAAQDLLSCCQQLGISILGIIPSPLASSEAVLSSDEKYLGVAMLDIGAGSTSFAHFYQGSIRHTAFLPIAGNHFTHDLAIGLRISLSEAERIKKEYGSVNAQGADSCPIDVEMIHGRDRHEIHQKEIDKILLARAKELLNLLVSEINKESLNGLLTAGLVLTGGGSQLHGLKELAEELFHCSVRIGTPHAFCKGIETMQETSSATVCGLLLYALHHQHMKDRDILHRSLGARVKEKVKNLVSDLFS
jgi:cell division protein FtsA